MEVTQRRSCTHKPAHKTAAQCPPGQARRRSSEARQLCSDRWPSRTLAPRRPQARPSGTRTANHGPPGAPEAAWAARYQQQQQRQQSALRRREWKAAEEPWPHLRSRRRQQLPQQPPPPPPPSARRSSGCAYAGGTRSRRASCRTCYTASGRCTGPSSGGTARTPWGSSPSRSQQHQHQHQQPARPRALVGPRALLRREPATP